MAIIPSQVLDANEDVIAYYLAKKQWNSEEFAALFCGVNPLVWARCSGSGCKNSGSDSTRRQTACYQREEYPTNHHRSSL